MKRLLGSLLVLGCAFHAAASANPVLGGPLRIVIPYGPGGGMDSIARPLVEPLRKKLGVPVVLDYRPGGGTKIGTALVASAEPDGRTLIFMSAPGWVGYFYEGTFDFKPWVTMTPIGQVAESPYSVIAVKAGGALKSWADVVAKAKQTGRPIMASAPAAGGFTELTLHEVARQSGFEGVLVPYASAAPARMALLTGEVDVQMDSMSALGGIRNQQSMGIAVSTAKRLHQIPDVPTFSELGLKVNLPTNSFSFWGPANMDKALVGRLAEAVREAIKDKAFIDTVEAQNLVQVGFKPGAEIQKEMKVVEAEWGEKLTASVKSRKKNP